MRIRKHGASVDADSAGVLNVSARSGKAVKVARQFSGASTSTALTPGATVALNAALGNFFTLTPAENCQINATNGVQGQDLTLKVLTSGTSSFTVTFGTGFKSTGTLATGTTTAKTFMVRFQHDGTNFVELSRTAAM